MSKFRISEGDLPLDFVCEGYIWRSNSSKPDLYKSERLLNLSPLPILPFVVEANLFDVQNRVSYLIRFFTKEYEIFRFDLKELNGAEYTEKSFLAGFKGAERLFFRQYWIEDFDCMHGGEDFFILKPAMNVFVGFSSKEE